MHHAWRTAGLIGVAAIGATILACAQSSSTQPTPPLLKPRVWRQKTVTFSNGKSVLGLQESGWVDRHCASDDTSFRDEYPNVTVGSDRTPRLLAVTPAGEVKRIDRKLPVGYGDVSVRDFFVADHTLVTLLRAAKIDDSGEPTRDIAYFLSLSDHDGGSASLLQLDLKFEPLKVALFGSGDFLILGWETANLLPTLAALKDDGTIRRFFDLDSHRPEEVADPHAYDSLKDAASSTRARSTLAMLNNARFVPFGSQVLLAYVGLARPIRVLSPVGSDRGIPVQYPPGFLLHDVINSGVSNTFVIRMQAAEDFETIASKGSVQNPKQRLFEVSTYSGSLIQEFLFDKPSPMAVTCACNNKLTAMFYEVVANSPDPPGAPEAAEAHKTETRQLVISTLPR